MLTAIVARLLLWHDTQPVRLTNATSPFCNSGTARSIAPRTVLPATGIAAAAGVTSYLKVLAAGGAAGGRACAEGADASSTSVAHGGQNRRSCASGGPLFTSAPPSISALNTAGSCECTAACRAP